MCAERSRVAVPGVMEWGGGVRLGRWERLLDDSDDARVWRAISWKEG